MCRLAYLHFRADVPADVRLAAVQRVLKASWNLGNKHGAGYASWTPGTEEGVRTERALKLDKLRFPALPESLGTEVLVHARFSTNSIALTHTHPFELAGAYLVHNGIVHAPENEAGDRLRTKARTNNDTELILKSYLAQDRSLVGALQTLSGQANTALWDETRGVLSLYADDRPFQVWRQGGVTMVVQEAAQATGVIRAGLGSPYEWEELPARKAIELPLPEALSDEAWTEALHAAETAAVTPTRPVLSYASFAATSALVPNYNRARQWVKDKETWVAYSGKNVVVNGRTYTSDGHLLSGRGLTKKEKRRQRRIEQTLDRAVARDRAKAERADADREGDE